MITTMKNKYQKTIAFDFDKVLCEYDHWKGEDIFGEPIVENIKILNEYKNKGFKIIIFTTRKDTSKMREWLEDNGVYYDEFVGNKPLYNCFIDDRTVNNLTVSDVRKAIDNVLGEAND